MTVNVSLTKTGTRSRIHAHAFITEHLGSASFLPSYSALSRNQKTSIPYNQSLLVNEHT